MMVGIEPVKAASVVSSKPSDVPAFMPQTKNTTFVNIVDLGTSANAYSYGYGGGQKEILASVPEVGNGIVTNFHRMGGALDPGGNTGDLGYDVSFDGGLSWTKMVEIYQAVNNAGGTYFTDAARYPSHGLYNPVGNTSADDVWLQYHAPNLDGSNATDSWGGYSYGVANLSDPQNTKTKNLQSSTPADGIYQYIIDAYDITRQGKVFAVDVNQDWSSGSVVYKGSLIVNKGEWDEAINDFVFTQELLAADVDPAVTRPSHVKTAFSEDGMTGYISMLADNGSCELINAQRSLYPIIFKTTDGGENWGDPVGIQLGGPNGLHGIVYDLLSDEQIADIYNEPLPARTEIPYTTAFDHDVVVDAAGNLHIAIVIGVTGSNDYSIGSGEYFFAAYDIFTTDGGTT